jgi:hypothetical protein
MRKRTFLLTIGAVMVVIGAVWFLQGIGILPGSVMSGQSFWAYAGAVLVIAGAVLGWLGAKRS